MYIGFDAITHRAEEIKKRGANHAITEMQMGVVMSLDYLQAAMHYTAAEAVDKYEESENTAAFNLACLLRVYTDQLRDIGDQIDAALQALEMATRPAEGQ
jgi:hypothetical protein